MFSSPLHIIHVEDSERDSELILQMLKSEGWDCHMERVETRNELLQALENKGPDLILSDNTLPQFHGLEALELAHAKRPDLPFIFVSGTIGEEVAIRSLQSGATDYVLKQRLSRLIPAVHRALAEAEGQKARQQMESQLRQARKLETLGTLAGGLAHDFRNVLQIFRMSLALIPLKSSDPEVLDLVNKLELATERGCSLVQELMVFARKTDATKTWVNLGQVILETVRLIKTGMAIDVELLTNVRGDLPAIMGDRGQIERVVTNLIINAQDAMPKGGTIMLSLDVIRFRPIPKCPWKIKNAPYLRLQIQDTGTGMNDETLSRLFEPFYTTKPAGKGTGLGLAVVYGLTEAHQGLIAVDSTVGKGTTFSLFFPIEESSVVPQTTEIDLPGRLLAEPNIPVA